MAVAGTGVADAGNGGVNLVVVPVEVASFRPSAEVGCGVGKGSGRLREREEDLSTKGVPNLPDREAFSGFLGINLFVVLVVRNVA